MMEEFLPSEVGGPPSYRAPPSRITWTSNHIIRAIRVSLRGSALPKAQAANDLSGAWFVGSYGADEMQNPLALSSSPMSVGNSWDEGAFAADIRGSYSLSRALVPPSLSIMRGFFPPRTASIMCHSPQPLRYEAVFWGIVSIRTTNFKRNEWGKWCKG